jgi:hypothetical protein
MEQPEDIITQSHSNMINVVGEYTYEYSIELDNGIIEPMIMNYKDGYRCHRNAEEGKFWLTQDGYKVCDQSDIDKLNFLLGTLRQKKSASAKTAYQTKASAYCPLPLYGSQQQTAN